MAANSKPLSLNAVMTGSAVFDADMPIWMGKFGDETWPFLADDEPLSRGASSNAITWLDYRQGRGATFGHFNSSKKSRYSCCLTSAIVADLKIAAVIHANFPAILNNAKNGKKQLDPKTVKARIDELAKIFSAVIASAKAKYNLSINRLQEISFGLLKESIAVHAGRGAHLKRALKLISDPIVQNNISAPLQWQLVDIEKGSIRWPKTVIGPGIPTLEDAHFLFIQNHCISSITRFKRLMDMTLHCDELGDSQDLKLTLNPKAFSETVHHFLKFHPSGGDYVPRNGFGYKEFEALISDVQCSSMMLILLLTGMRSSETKFLLRDSLVFENGYWFIKSKVVKNRPKDLPIGEGWLAVDIVRDAYDVLAFFCEITGNEYLFSSPFGRFVPHARGYAMNSLNTKFSRWLPTFDVGGLYSGWKFSIHQCRETLVFQLAKQQVGLPFISMQLKHFQSRFYGMPNDVTASYGKYRAGLMTAVASRIAGARESALFDLFGESARFAGGGAPAHKVRVDTFFAGIGLFGEERVRYIKSLAIRGVKVQPTSIGGCTRNFELPVEDTVPPCYGDFECDPECGSHVITERGALALAARRDHALVQAQRESNSEFKIIWFGLAKKLDGHVKKLDRGGHHAK